MKTITELIKKYDAPELYEIQFDIDVAFYHGQMTILNQLHKHLGDDPEVAKFVREWGDLCNANMAEIIGG